MTILIHLLFSVFLFNSTAHATGVQAEQAEQTEQELTKMTKTRIEEVMKTLQDKKRPVAERNKKILEVVNSIFDFEQMARLSLGKKHWLKMSEAAQKQFIESFVIRLQESYLDKLKLYTDERVEVEAATKEKNRYYIRTFLVSKGDKKEIIYKFYEKDSSWKVYDVEVLGVSIIQTYRTQFEDFLKKSTTEELLKKLATPKALDEKH